LHCRLVLSQNKKELLVNWWNEGKLEPGEEMGDLVRAFLCSASLFFPMTRVDGMLPYEYT